MDSFFSSGVLSVDYKKHFQLDIRFRSQYLRFLSKKLKEVFLGLQNKTFLTTVESRFLERDSTVSQALYIANKCRLRSESWCNQPMPEKNNYTYH